MTNIILKNLSDKQRQAWIMRYRFRWRLKRVALELGLKPPAVSRLLYRAQLSAGLKRPIRINIIRAKPRLAPTQSLSTAFNY
jgi:predicted transcriptional regulator